jgi:hypothetical protein
MIFVEAALKLDGGDVAGIGPATIGAVEPGRLSPGSTSTSPLDAGASPAAMTSEGDEIEMPDASPWVQVIGTAIGGLATFAGVLVAQRMTAVREREARRIEAEERLRRQRAEFQVKTLLELQEAFLELLKVSGKIHLAHEEAFKRTGEWGRCPPGDMSERERELLALTLTRTVRVEDDALRSSLQELRALVRLATGARSEHDALGHGLKIINTFDVANSRIGELLRSLC